MPVHNNLGEVIGQTPLPIAVVSDNGPCFRGETVAQAFSGPDPLLRHVRTRVRSPRTNGVVERFFGSLKYEHLYQLADQAGVHLETLRYYERRGLIEQPPRTPGGYRNYPGRPWRCRGSSSAPSSSASPAPTSRNCCTWMPEARKAATPPEHRPRPDRPISIGSDAQR
jgi:hypothetical protein